MPKDQLTQTRIQAQGQDQDLVDHENSSNDSDAPISAYKARLAEADAKVADLEKTLSETRERLDARDGELAVLRAAFDRIESTYSWRITKPLRAGLDAFKSARQRLREFGYAQGYGNLRRDMRSRFRELPLMLPAGIWRWTTTGGPLAAHEGTPEISIIIPVFNRMRLTRRCLHSLIRHESSHTFEVIVVDDASTDKTPAVVGKIPKVRLVRREQNGGFGSSCNLGAREARGQFLVFLNNDTTVCDGWLDALRETFDDWPNAGVVGSKLIFMDGTIQECGGLIFRDGSAANYGRGGDPRDARYCFTRETDYVSGAAIMIRSELFRDLEGFDPRYEPAYYEDTDLALRVHDNGLQVIVNPHAEVNHIEGGTAGTDLTKGIKRHQVINQEKFLDRWKHELARFPVPPTGKIRPRKRGPRVLVVDHQVPRPDRDSGSLRMAGILRALTKLGCDVALGAGGFRCDKGHERQFEKIGVEVLRPPYYNDVLAYFREEGASFDFVILSRRDVATQYIELVERYCPNAKIIFDTVDLHFVREGREAELGEGDASATKLDNTKALELALVARTDVTLVVSLLEQEILKSNAPDKDIRVVSNILDVRPTARSFSERSGLLFIGSFQHPPNAGAVLWFVKEVLPELARKGFRPMFHVIGAGPPKELLALRSEQIKFHGFVPDVEPMFDACLMSVAPLLYGAGVKGKINQSMAFGVPVVTTTIGAEGMLLDDGVNCLIADDPNRFAAHIHDACHSEEIWTSLREQGLKNVEAYFSPQVAEAALRELIFPGASTGEA